MKIHNCVQGELEWYQLRAGRVTASEASALLTPEFKISEGKGVYTYLCTKVAEKFGKNVLPSFSSWETEYGQIQEDKARKWYAFEYDERLKNVGFCESDDGRCGCSPDALIGDESGLEIKCPQPTNHVRYVLDGILPKDYAVQVHFSMFVTNRDWWRFVSYHDKFPPLALKVERDDKIDSQIRKALDQFYERFDAALEKLKSA